MADARGHHLDLRAGQARLRPAARRRRWGSCPRSTCRSPGATTGSPRRTSQGPAASGVSASRATPSPSSRMRWTSAQATSRCGDTARTSSTSCAWGGPSRTRSSAGSGRAPPSCRRASRTPTTGTGPRCRTSTQREHAHLHVGRLGVGERQLPRERRPRLLRGLQPPAVQRAGLRLTRPPRVRAGREVEAPRGQRSGRRRRRRDVPGRDADDSAVPAVRATCAAVRRTAGPPVTPSTRSPAPSATKCSIKVKGWQVSATGPPCRTPRRRSAAGS